MTALARLLPELRACTLCEPALPLGARPIFQLDRRAPILSASQAPGRVAHEKGRPFDDLTLLAGTVTSAILGNAFLCAVISGPHDRYGARMAWLATMVVLITAIRLLTGESASRGRSLPA